MKPVIAITLGDPAGIGPQIALKALEHAGIYSRCTPLLVGDKAVVENTLQQLGLKRPIHLVQNATQLEEHRGGVLLWDTQTLQNAAYPMGKVDTTCAKAAYQALLTAIDLAKRGLVQAVATAPICKEAMQKAGCEYTSHTEMFAHLTNTKRYAMVLMSGRLRVIHVSTHVSLKEACERVKTPRVLEVIALAHQTLCQLGIPNGRIGVAGLNPHAGENGMFGEEEQREILPAIEAARQQGINASGPYPPDSVFVRARAGEFDMVVAMYHDQGHIPLKMAGFWMDAQGKMQQISGINYTAGLPIIRTSVDHGTAFDKAGGRDANEQSMLEAIETAILMAQNKPDR